MPHTLYFHVCTNFNENIVAPISHSLEKYTKSGDLRLLLMIVFYNLRKSTKCQQTLQIHQIKELCVEIFYYLRTFKINNPKSTILNALSFKCFVFVMVLWAAGTLIMSHFCTFPFANYVQIYLGMGFFLCCLSNWPVSYSRTCFLFSFWLFASMFPYSNVSLTAEEPRDSQPTTM